MRINNKTKTHHKQLNANDTYILTPQRPTPSLPSRLDILQIMMLQTPQYIVAIITLPPAATSLTKTALLHPLLLCWYWQIDHSPLHFYYLQSQHHTVCTLFYTVAFSTSYERKEEHTSVLYEIIQFPLLELFFSCGFHFCLRSLAFNLKKFFSVYCKVCLRAASYQFLLTWEHLHFIFIFERRFCSV